MEFKNRAYGRLLKGEKVKLNVDICQLLVVDTTLVRIQKAFQA